MNQFYKILLFGAFLALSCRIESVWATGTAIDLDKYANQLNSDQVGEWREAVIQMAKAGAASLPRLEDGLTKQEFKNTTRITYILDLLLLKSIHYSDFKQFPKLAQLIQPQIDSANTRLANGRGVKLRFEEHSGFLVPGLILLLKSDNPYYRASAGLELLNMNAFVTLPELQQLQSDSAPITLHEDDYVMTTSVSKYIGEKLNTHSWWLMQIDKSRYEENRIAMEVETYIFEVKRQAKLPYDGRNELENRLRQLSEGAAFRAKTWDEWWMITRMDWNTWWATKHT